MIEVKLSVNGVVVGRGSLPDSYIKLLDEGSLLTARIDLDDPARIDLPVFVDLQKKEDAHDLVR